MSRALAHVAAGLRSLVSRGVVRRVDDGPKMQELQVEALADELLDGCEHWQAFGFRAVPQVGAEALVLAQGGGRERALVVCVADRRYRVDGLESGGVAIFDAHGHSVVLGAAGIVITGDVTINGTLTTTGNASVAGNLAVTGLGSVASTLAVGGLTTAGTAGGTLSMAGSLATSGDLAAGGTVSGATLKMGTKTLSTTGTPNVVAS